MSENSVIYAFSGITGAPTISGTPGTLRNVLDACLVDGWNLRSPTQISVASGVVTVTFATSHGFFAPRVVLVEGSPVADLNGRKRVTGSVTNSFTFLAPGVPDQTVTGTISVKYASAGWERVFSDASSSVYRSPNPQSTRLWLRVRDVDNMFAEIQAAESFSDVNTFFNGFAFGYWWKSQAESATTRAWFFVGDDRTFYLDIAAGSQGYFYGFGDIVSVRPNDPFACFVTRAASNVVSSSSNFANRISMGFGMHSGNIANNITNRVLARSANGISRARAMVMKSAFSITGASPTQDPDTSGGSESNNANVVFSQYPDPATNGLILGPVSVIERDLPSYRGQMPGLYFSPQLLSTVFSRGEILSGSGVLSGKSLIAMDYSCIQSSAAAGSTNYNGRVFFDITGPWQ